MAARGMSAAAPATAAWVVVPPFADDKAWRAAVVKAAASAGRRVYDLDATLDAPPVEDPSAVLLTSDAARPMQAGAPAEALAGLMIDSGIRLDPDDDPAALSTDIIRMTDLVGRIALLPPKRIFRRKDFVDGPVEILPKLTLAAPDAVPERRLSPRHRAIADAVTLLDPTIPRAIWSPALFNYNSRVVAGGGLCAPDPTRRPRRLLAGPYIVLPAGRWRATYRLAFDQGGSRARFRVDWGGVEDYLSEEFRPGRAGVFEVVQDYVWTSPGPAEIRLILLEGVFDGQVVFSDAEISRVG